MAPSIKCEEVSVALTWGTLRGKLWRVGPTTTGGLRIVAVHGWLDNANSFANIVPLLPQGTTILALDLPGHGLSDHLPKGALYDGFSHALNLRNALLELQWNSSVFLAHSMGAFVATIVTAMWPELVEGLIKLDWMLPLHAATRLTAWRYDANIHAKSEDLNTPPPVYSKDEMIERMVSSRGTGLAKDDPADAEDSAKLLLERDCRPERHGYTWTHDPKARTRFMSIFGLDNYYYMLSNISCPILVIVGDNGFLAIESDGIKESIATMKESYFKNAPNAEYHMVQGTHHLHMTQPQNAIPFILKFLHNLNVLVQSQAMAKL
ncbi:unnamed protein product [Meganyctiphanes norvegica]|uniref:AB hydrolase-1 domain-containing protein n=1 Tax=Meganyctiphanes norvegica TaxID=48144 RepID=A0AAV2QBY6_MEGNR